MEWFENFESNFTSHRYWAPGFTHPSEVETLPILPTCGHGCGPAERVLPGGKATQGWIQEHLWEEEAAASKRSAAKSLQSCPTVCDPVDGNPPRLPRPWDSPGKNTGVGCHCLLQCMKVKSESEVTQSCPTLSDPMDWSLPGSSVHGIFQARVLEWGAIAFSSKRSTCHKSHPTPPTQRTFSAKLSSLEFHLGFWFSN